MTATTTTLPAAWLIATGATPANLAERSTLRRDTARKILARQLNLPEGAIAIAHDDKGRPLLSCGPGATRHISLATRAGHVAVALATRAVGVDVERIDPEAGIPHAILHPREHEALDLLPPARRPLAFARIWSAKEAYVKALGLGFARAPESFCVTLTEADGFVVLDRESEIPIIGAGRIIENGGQEILAAAMVTIG